jgi:phosphatidyl-myo-inositol dimannoside synthase
MLLLATELWRTHGGVQRYMRMIADILASQNGQLTVISLLDRDTDRPDNIEAFHACCSGGSKSKFCRESLKLSRLGAGRTTVVGHVSLLPVAYTLQKTGLIDRCFLVLHGIEAWRRLPWMCRIAARNTAAVVATTRYTAREFSFHNGIPDAKCKIIPLACSFDLPKLPRQSPVRQLNILTVTRLMASDAYKGVETILLGIQEARHAGFNVELDLVGSGDDQSRLEKLASFLNIHDAVRFRGSVNDGELKELFRNSHVFVLPSKNEGFGIAFLEAMAAGLPCIGANHGGTPEVIEHGETGFLIEYGDVAQLVFYLQVLLDSPQLYEVMSQAARRRATQTLSCDAMARAWTRLLADCNNSGPNSSCEERFTKCVA